MKTIKYTPSLQKPVEVKVVRVRQQWKKSGLAGPWCIRRYMRSCKSRLFSLMGCHGNNFSGFGPRVFAMMGLIQVFKIGVIILIFSGLSVSQAMGRTWTVQKDGSGDFTVIQDAVDAASDGDVIDIGPGRYREYQDYPGGEHIYVYLDGSKSLTFMGAGADQTIIGPDEYQFDSFAIKGLTSSTTLRFEDLGVTNTWAGFSLRNESANISQCWVYKCHLGIKTSGDSGSLSVVDSIISHCLGGGSTGIVSGWPDLHVKNVQFIRNFDGMNLNATGSPSAVVESCTFDGESLGQAGVSFTSGGSGIVRHCIFRALLQFGCGAVDSGTIVFHDNLMENCGTAGVVIGGGTSLTMHDNIIQNSSACLFYGTPCDQQSIRNNHFFRDEAADGLFVETIYYFPFGPFDIDLSGNYWGTTDLDEINLWTLDGHDFDNVGMYMVFDPVADGPVHTERMSWSGVKTLYR